MILIVDFGSSKVPDIVRVMNDLGQKALIKKWDEEMDVRKIKGIILSGAPVLLTKTDVKPYLEKFSFLRTTDIPLLGICFGHQLIGLLFGGNVFLGKENRAGAPIRLINTSVLFKKLPNPVTFKEDHTEGISLPKEFICTAASNDYEIEAMQHVSKKIFGVQFHPEVSGENGRILLNNFLKLLQ